MKRQETLVLTRREIAGLMEFQDYVEAVEEAFRLSAEGKACLPSVVDLKGRDGTFHIKAASIERERIYAATKINGNFPFNMDRFGLPTIQGVIVLCDGEDGFPLALMDSIEVTVQRTGAATALAAKHLARPDSKTATVCGCGNQGRIQLVALKHVLPLERAFAFDANRDAATAFARRMTDELGIPVTALDELDETTRQSDVIATCTTSRRAFLSPDHVGEGTFIAAVGADGHEKSELEPRLTASAKVVVDVLEQCASIGDLHHALEQGAMTRTDTYAELWEILVGSKPGRTSPEEVIVFDSTGTALQDVSSAVAILERAQRAGVGIKCGLGG